MSEYDFLFKFIVIGDAATGKSCLLHRFIENKFNRESQHTIGVEFGAKVVDVGGKKIKLQIWDTAGQERFRSVTRSYYKGAAGALLVYDVTSRDSYNNISSWLNDARSLSNTDIVIMLVGNKTDRADRDVQFLEASRFSEEHGICFRVEHKYLISTGLIFVETSALTGDGVEEVFLKCGRTILSKINDGKIDPLKLSGVQKGTVTPLPPTPPPKNNSDCC
ncbi:GTP-binding protein RAB4 [Pelomyxa schiedti]|nr:GTP-binding protein RAB4 [Pelomyxa schiedti]